MTRPSDARTAGRWHAWCADCGAKTHKHAAECGRCGAGSGGEDFLVKYRGNVGDPEYTTRTGQEESR